MKAIQIKVQGEKVEVENLLKPIIPVLNGKPFNKIITPDNRLYSLVKSYGEYIEVGDAHLKN